MHDYSNLHRKLKYINFNASLFESEIIKNISDEIKKQHVVEKHKKINNFIQEAGLID